MERRPSRPALVAFDCDGTLVRNYYRSEYGHGALMFRGGTEARPEVVDVLKAFAALPWVEVLVWSAGGKPWATEVVKRLGLEDDVDYIDGKYDWASKSHQDPDTYRDPDIYFDDNGIAAFGKVWVHVDPTGDQGAQAWEWETYLEKKPCSDCGWVGCDVYHEPGGTIQQVIPL